MEISKAILAETFENFSIREDMPNKKYLEMYLTYLEDLKRNYKLQSENANVDQIIRAKARDFEQNCIGLINGIKFGISFFEYRDIDLLTYKEE